MLLLNIRDNIKFPILMQITGTQTPPRGGENQVTLDCTLAQSSLFHRVVVRIKWEAKNGQTMSITQRFQEVFAKKMKCGSHQSLDNNLTSIRWSMSLFKYYFHTSLSE